MDLIQLTIAGASLVVAYGSIYFGEMLLERYGRVMGRNDPSGGGPLAEPPGEGDCG